LVVGDYAFESTVAKHREKNMTKILTLLLLPVLALLIGLYGAACAQKPVVSDPNEVTIDFKHPATPVDMKKRLISLNEIPDSSTLPNPFQLVGNRSYLIESKTIDLGMPIVTVKVPVDSEEEFKKLRILRRVENELSESGYEWRDCTVSRDPRTRADLKVDSPEYQEHLKSYERYYSKYFPDYSVRTISCEMKPERLKPEEYFAVVRQIDAPPVKAFTDLKLSVLETAPSAPGKETTYKMSFTNGGQKNIGSVTIRSIFESDIRVTFYTPSKGTCNVPRKLGNPRVICFLGELGVGETTTLELRGTPTGFKASGLPGEPSNRGWVVDAVILERANDPLWTVNYFLFQPLRDK
jgi:hypothetical protein